MKLFSCYYEEFDDIGTFINSIVIYNHNYCEKECEKIRIKNVTILPVKLRGCEECEGYFQFETNVQMENLQKVIAACHNLDLMGRTMREGISVQKQEYFIV